MGTNGVMLGEVFSSRLLGTATDLADHDNTAAIRISQKNFQAIDEVGTVEGISADTHAQRLPESGLEKEFE